MTKDTFKEIMDYIDNLPDSYWNNVKKDIEKKEQEKQNVYKNMEELTDRICKYCDTGKVLDNEKILCQDDMKKVCTEVELSYFIDYYFQKAINRGQDIETENEFGEQEIIIEYNGNKYSISRVFGQGTVECVRKINDDNINWNKKLNKVNSKILNKEDEIIKLKERINILERQIKYLNDNDLVEAKNHLKDWC